MNTEQKPYPIERVLTDADHLAQVAEQLLQALNKLAGAEAKAELEETEENTEAVEQYQSEVADFFTGVRLATHEYLKRARRYRESVAPAIKDSLTTDRQPEPVAWVRFCSDGCYEGPLMNSSPAMDGARRTSGAWTPLFAAQLVARDVLMAAMRAAVTECAEICDVYSAYKGARCASEIRHPIMNGKLADMADCYAARLPVEMHSTGLNDRKAAEIIQAQGFTATGYVLSGPDGRYALCNGGAVRWLDKADYQHTMFPEGEHSPVPVPSRPNQYGLDTPYFARWLNRIIPRLDYYRPDDFARELGRMAAAADKTALLQDQLSGAVAQEGTNT